MVNTKISITRYMHDNKFIVRTKCIYFCEIYSTCFFLDSRRMFVEKDAINVLVDISTYKRTIQRGVPHASAWTSLQSVEAQNNQEHRSDPERSRTNICNLFTSDKCICAI